MTDQRPQTTDPHEQHQQPDTEGEQLPDPGSSQSVTSSMGEEPDHGEESYRGTGKLTDKVALITGGDSGIGRAVALAFAREGADVVLSFLDEEIEDARKTAEVVEAAGRTAVTMPGDLQDASYCEALIQRSVDELGGVDILVNNAAYQMVRGGLADISPEELDRTFRVNIIAMFHTCRAALEHMQAGGAIINTASIQAYQPAPMLMAYAATKAAIVNFTANLAQETIERGIRVHAVAPGPVWTPLIPATMPEEQVEDFGGDGPVGRTAQPAELAPA